MDLKKAVKAFCVTAMVLSLLFAVYPLINSRIRESQTTEATQKELSIQSQIHPSFSEVEMEKARDYNERLREGAVREEEYEELLNEKGDEIMGVVEIPSINTILPILHYSSDNSLSLGAGHVYGSSLPVPCGCSHSVLAGHSSFQNQRLFSDLDEMEVGDRFFLYVMGERFEYEVDKVSIVEPDDISETAVEPGKDYVTLLTCTPKGINSHRLLVRGRLVY